MELAPQKVLLHYFLQPAVPYPLGRTVCLVLFMRDWKKLSAY